MKSAIASVVIALVAGLAACESPKPAAREAGPVEVVAQSASVVVDAAPEASASVVPSASVSTSASASASAKK